MAFLRILVENLLKGPSTEAFPFAEAPTPAAYRGKVEFDADTCVACGMCEHVCAGGAIRFAEEEQGLRFMIWHNTCISCGLCAYYCPTKAITMTTNWHLSHPQSEKYDKVDQGLVRYAVCEHCGKTFMPANAALMNLAHKGVSERASQLGRLCPECRQAASLPGVTL